MVKKSGTPPLLAEKTPSQTNCFTEMEVKCDCSETELQPYVKPKV